ncbi:PD-(D/E)XK nuclease family transposase [Sporofaciens sp. SGI.106]|uniref:PD-(D/E)XK nuclease family transposase n=1 Tax=Sporofaciens sp. SGI.106 TaxID=3420568 RepID=UPI003CFE91A8
MANKLKQHFPMIRDREEIIAEIHSKQELLTIFNDWNDEGQKQFLDFCTGVRGVKLLYDQFFKEIINPDSTPERLEELLSLLLQEKVTILKVLPTDSARIAAESSLLILDIVVQLEDGSIANVEAQKIGYAFPGQRSACYSADLLMRQYKRVKGEKGKKFSCQSEAGIIAGIYIYST